MKAAKVSVTCPKCGHTQAEPSTAYSTVCKKCRQHFRPHDAQRPAAKAREQQPREHRQVTCFKCAASLDVPLSAQSTMCKRCSSHVDLRDYQITNAVSKNFKTKGRFVIEESGFLFNTESIAGEVILKGRLLGKLTAERSLEIYNTAEIKGSFNAAKLIIPAGNRFRWPQTLLIGSAEIGGELTANVRASETVVLKSTARFFGNVEAGGLVVEEGAVFVGTAKIGTSSLASRAGSSPLHGNHQ
jgi:cytoskeletal protein CcmA (bactofilin family)